jgi:DNA-binding NarL/FixJ family response regulator
MKILLVDDHVLFREGMRYVLQQLQGGVSEIFEAGNFPDGLKLAGQHPELDLALLDLNMPGSEGPISVKFFNQSYPHIPVVVVSGEDGYGIMEKVMNYGAMGFVCKNSAVPVMLGALNLVLAGGIYTPPQLLQVRDVVNGKAKRRAGQHNLRAEEHGLTNRQLQTLTHIASGLSNREIAEKMCLAEGTVKVHIATIFQVLCVSSRVGAVRAAEKLKLIGAAPHG